MVAVDRPTRQGFHGGVTWGALAADGGGGGKTGKPHGQGQLPRAGGPQASLLSEWPVPLKDNLHGGRSPQEAELQTRGHGHPSRATGTRSPVFPVDAVSVPMEVGAWGLEALGTAEVWGGISTASQLSTTKWKVKLSGKSLRNSERKMPSHPKPQSNHQLVMRVE